ncbi:hypothetical protein CesoFtcFv8_016401 [Champsocephalus esox]|uniref:Major facilitator superfamily (MFS) profile domain-containing protein n=1 Tax=Champsocephalus esox TaxID=159716 RepID=A0AAN8BM25_9TELE|nr:hypothetical protein CesoFtcFv8_016401 [Champsocephalus esox]
MTSAFCVVYTFSSELFPTVIRSTAMGCCSMAARIGSIISPFIIYLGQFNKSLPYILIGGFALCGALLCFLLPETFGKPLPETMAQMQLICRPLISHITTVVMQETQPIWLSENLFV